MAGRRSGFTLIELLVVIIIIGLLVIIALPKFGSSKERAYDASALADLRNAIVAAEAYYADNMTYPSDISDMDFIPSSGVVFTRFSRETQNGAESLHIHVEHVNSSHYFHRRYPGDQDAEKRKK